MACLTEALSYPSPQVKRLCKMGDAWRESSAPKPASYEPTYHRGSPEALEAQLGPAGVEQFVREYLNGAMVRELAAKHGFGLTALDRTVAEESPTRLVSPDPSHTVRPPRP